jgi:hypothetical protein
MDVVILEQDRMESGSTWMVMKCGKRKSFVYAGKSCISVCCINASAKAFNRGGRSFPTFSHALAAYKSPEMKSMISRAAAYAS